MNVREQVAAANDVLRAAKAAGYFDGFEVVTVRMDGPVLDSQASRRVLHQRVQTLLRGQFPGVKVRISCPRGRFVFEGRSFKARPRKREVE